MFLVIFEMSNALCMSFDETRLQGSQQKKSFMAVDVRFEMNDDLCSFIERWKNIGETAGGGLTYGDERWMKVTDDYFVLTLGYDMAHCQTVEAEADVIQTIINEVDTD